MIAEIGHFALIIAFMLSIAQSVVPMLGAHYGDGSFMRFGSSAANGEEEESLDLIERPLASRA